MKRIGLTTGFVLTFSIAALAHGPAGQSGVILAFNSAPGTYVGVPAYFAPTAAYWGPYYRPSLSRHQWREAQRLRRHQWRERHACRSFFHDGRCRNLGRHQRNEWRRLQRHHGRERNLSGWRRDRW
jgi:hypothetical protein